MIRNDTRSRTELPLAEDLRLRRSSRVLEVRFVDGAEFSLPFEYLRVFSPSAEVRGHGGGEPTLVTGKQDVDIERVEPVGQYAVRLCFDDGHRTGIYSWAVLYELGRDYAENWRRYRERVTAAEPEASS
ncbi:MAG: gamma-butyrobetaine hydroxylase-like domain-containing protein [Salinisphaeraceae bacterium]